MLELLALIGLFALIRYLSKFFKRMSLRFNGIGNRLIRFSNRLDREELAERRKAAYNKLRVYKEDQSDNPVLQQPENKETDYITKVRDEIDELTNPKGDVK